MKICIVSSCGGHLTEVQCLMSVYKDYEYFYVLNDKVILPFEMKDRTLFISHSERDWKLFLNIWQAYQILRKEKPDVILSTGAGPVVPFAIIGRLLFRVRVIFVETITRVRSPSLTGRIMYHLAHEFYYQHPELKKYFPRGIYGGTVV